MKRVAMIMALWYAGYSPCEPVRGIGSMAVSTRR